jgi:DNA-binding transcriptional MerR regulator
MNASFARAYLGIGEVLVELRAEFPDISVSKIRFLESEGLISPARSPSGYRRFAPVDVEQLRYILTAQRDEYLPLRVIKERLDVAEGAGGAGGRPPAGYRAEGAGGAGGCPPAGYRAEGAGGAGGRPPGGQIEQRNASASQSQDTGAVRTEMLSRRELLDAAGIDEKMLAELEAHGLVKRAGRLYGQDAVDIAATVAALARHGVQARNLRTVSTAADRDLSLIEQLVGPVLRQRGPAARQTAGQTATQLATLLLRLHRHLLEAGLAEAGLASPVLTAAEPSHEQTMKGASA